MGELAEPTPAERDATIALAREITRSVEEDTEGPLPLPEFGKAKPAERVELLKAWWENADLQMFRLAQDLVDTRAALEIACAMLAGADVQLGWTSFAHRLRVLDIPSQDEIDQANRGGGGAGSVIPCAVDPAGSP